MENLWKKVVESLPGEVFHRSFPQVLHRFSTALHLYSIHLIRASKLKNLDKSESWVKVFHRFWPLYYY